MKAARMKIASLAILSIAFAAVLSSQENSQQTSKAAGKNQKMSMSAMQKECQQHCSSRGQSISQLTQRLNQAEQSNDPAKMKAAIQEAKGQLNEMNSHMTACMNKMSMKNMHHQGMMQDEHMKDMGGMMGTQQQKPEGAPPKL
jgi:hypothetical protein